MFTCTLDSKSRTTLTDQLFGALRDVIMEGRMAHGARMPSKRQLAEHLHVSPATVEAAYGRLASEGYCESRPRSGMYVAENLPEAIKASYAAADKISFEKLHRRSDIGARALKAFEV